MSALNLPTDVQIEREVLASCTVEDPTNFLTVRSLLSERDFSAEPNRRIFRALCRLSDAGRALTMTEVFRSCQEHKEPVEVGYIIETESFPWAIERYVARLIELTARRLLILRGDSLMREAADCAIPLEDVIGRSNTALSEIANDPSRKEEPEEINAIIEAAGGMVKFLEAITGVSSPWNEFNGYTGGWQNGELALIGARPSMGKTALAINALVHAAESGVPSVFYSFEMTKEAIVRRLLCLRTGLSYQQLISGSLSQSEKYEVDKARVWLANLPIRIIHASGRPALAVRVHAERLQRRGQCGFIVVDYIGLIKAPDSSENRSRQLGEICRQLKETAAVLNIPALVLAQLNRATANRDDKRPGLPDLRDSGELEEHADLVAFLHRPGYYNRNEPALEHVAELIIAKQRNGDTPIINLDFFRRSGRFADPQGYEQKGAVA